MSALCLLLLSPCLAQPPMPAPAVSSTTEAEKIARLQRYVEEGEKQLESIRKQLADPASEYHRAQAEFKAIDEQSTKWKRDLERLQKEGKKAEADAIVADLASLDPKRKRARERADLALQERKTLQEKAASLPAKIGRERKALERLTGTASVTPAAAEKKPEEKKPAQSEPGTKTDAKELKEPAKKPEDATKAAREHRRLREARNAVQFKQEAADKARDKANIVTEYIDHLKRQIELEQRLLETARKKLALARDSQADLEGEQQKRVEGRAPKVDVERGWEEINAAVKRVDEATIDEREITDRLTELQAQLSRAKARQIAVLQDADQSSSDAASARKKLDELENPFHPRNIAQWFLDHGAKLGAILVGMIVLYLMVRTGTKRIVNVMTTARRRQGGRESEDRAATLVGVFRNTMSAFILGGGLLMLLDEVGIPIVPLMGGAAVLGLAVAFGAQNLIKDYFTGFMVLMEDQYAVNDVVRINGVDGKVERITLRMTVLRDLAGIAHFIPHGTITTVSNMSHGWSRAMLEIGIGYREDPDRVLEVLKDICSELKRDEHYASLMLEDAEMLGVDQLADSAVVLKFVVKTKAQEQWKVKRELLRRIKYRFDQLGIEIPYPHRTVYHRKEAYADAPRLVA